MIRSFARCVNNWSLGAVGRSAATCGLESSVGNPDQRLSATLSFVAIIVCSGKLVEAVAVQNEGI
jgi:hypothetical protein